MTADTQEDTRPATPPPWGARNDGRDGIPYDPDDLDLPMGKPELAARCGYPLRTVHKWDQRGNLPAPDFQVSSMDGWRWRTLLLFLFRTDRTANLADHDYQAGLQLLDEGEG